MKKYLLFASAILAFASCTSESYNGTEEDFRSAAGDKAITFGSGFRAVTRADKTGKDAADDLNGQFIVWGEKGEPTTGSTGAAYSADATDDHQLVFKNYVVSYSYGSDYTTTSNTKGWEYVGITPAYGSNVSPAAGETQTIKYWDFGASNYVFTAVSALPEDINNGRVTITKTQSGTTAYDKGYTVILTKTSGSPDVYPSLADLYFSDRNVITAKGSNRDTPNQYGGNATMTFRNSLTQVRVGMFEDIPGYSVSAISFKVTSDATAVDASSNPAFGAICPNVKADKFEGSIAVTYYDDNYTTENQPKLEITPASGLAKTDLILGTNINAITTAAPLATSAASPTWDTSGGEYTSVLPQIENDQNLKLKVNYTLYNATTGETITVENATAEIDQEYLQWKPNFKYTYIFKISDNSNGYTGPNTDPAGLYPITFDAVVVVAEDGQAEYITTVSEPSITTFGVKNGKYVHDGNEYEAGSDIYATFMEGGDVKTPVLGTSGEYHVNVFVVETPDATNFPITEAAVAEAIAAPAASITNAVYTFNGTDTYTQVTDAANLVAGTTYYKADANSVAPGGSGYVQTVAVAGTDYQVGPKLTVTNINNSDNGTYFTDEKKPTVESTVPGEDGVDITIKAVKLPGVVATTTTTAYAIEYEASAAWTGSYKKVYKVIRVQ